MATSSQSPTANEMCGEQPSHLFEALLGRTIERQNPDHSSPAQGKNEAALGKIDGVVIGRLVGLDAGERFLVRCNQFPTEEPLVAFATVALHSQHIGREVALSFIDGNLHHPIILGLLHVAAEPPRKEGDPETGTVQVRRDNEQLVLSAEREIVLRCGESSITLTREGKITIRGKHLLSRAEAVNRIKGGAVQIN